MNLSRVGHHSPSAQASGFCIRCRAPTPFDPSKPYCAEHFAQWHGDTRGDEDERWCHRCGARYPARFEEPLCSPCYRTPP